MNMKIDSELKRLRAARKLISSVEVCFQQVLVSSALTAALLAGLKILPVAYKNWVFVALVFR